MFLIDFEYFLVKWYDVKKVWCYLCMFYNFCLEIFSMFFFKVGNYIYFMYYEIKYGLDIYKYIYKKKENGVINDVSL